MRKFLFSAVLVACASVGSSASALPEAPASHEAIGHTKIAQWKSNKRAAFCMLFDDSKVTQADHAVTALVKRNLVGTFFVNPGNSQYRARRRTWEVVCPATGQELGNHSMHHIGARSYTEADYEIGECARRIWSARPEGASPLMAFARGGGTTWNISRQQMAQLMTKYHCVGRRSDSMTNADRAKMLAKVQEALDKGTWVSVHFHGIGGQGLPVALSDFLALLDHLVTVRDRLWIGTYTGVLKYVTERDSATVEVQEATDDLIRLKLSTDLDAALYDEPLTLITRAPAHWAFCTVTHADASTVVAVGADGTARYDVIPGRGDVTLRQSQTPPNGRPRPVIKALPCSGEAPVEVAFTGSGSTDPDGDRLQFSWDFGDGAGGQGETASHVYNEPGAYLVTLCVTDGAEASELDAVLIVASATDAGTLEAHKTAGPLELDGRLNEPDWGQAHPVTFRDPSRSDNTATVSAVWTESHLYFGYAVLDDDVEATGETLSRDDGAEIRLDVHHDVGSVCDPNDYHLIATVGGKTRPPEAAAASASCPGGYTMEIAIPWKAMKARPGPGTRMGLFLACFDRDPGAAVWFDWPALRSIYAGYEPNLWGDLVLRDRRK